MGYNFGVGREAPTFTLTAHDGDQVTLKQYRGDWFAALVFVADGAALAGRVAEVGAAAGQLWGYRCQLVGIAHQDAAALSAALADPAPAFPVLADTDGAVARAYGAWDGAVGAARDYVALVDRSGKIVWTGDGGAAPVKPAEIVAALQSIAR